MSKTPIESTKKGKLESKGHQSPKKWQEDTNCKKKHAIGIKTPIVRGPSNLCPEDAKKLAYKAKAIYSTAKTTNKLEKVSKRKWENLQKLSP